MSFKGKIALVTGAGRGLGKALSHALVKREATLIAVSRTQATLDELKTELPGITTICCDIGNFEETRKAVQAVGRVDLLVNNAAVNVPGTMMQISPKDFQYTMNCNLLAAINITQIVAAGMIERKSGGAIVNMSSIAARKPIVKQGMYGMSKIALHLMMKSFALDLGCHNIRVNNAELGIFPSEMSRKALSNPKSHLIEQYRRESFLCRIGDVDEVVNATLFLLSDKSSFITGQVVGVCGGFN